MIAPAMALLALSACGGSKPPVLIVPPAPTAARGEYLVKSVLICKMCHAEIDPTTKQPSTDPAAPLSGGRDFPIAAPDGGVGHVYARNITPDQATGIGGWTTDEIKRALSQGIDKEGQPLYPTMPYSEFSQLTDTDIASIALYLQAQAAVANEVPEPSLTVPSPAPLYLDSDIPLGTVASSDPSYATVQAGRYLVRAACAECHTPGLQSSTPLARDFAKVFAGGRAFKAGPKTVLSSNLTPDATGLMGWTAADIKATLATDHEKGSGVQLCPPMPGGPQSLGTMTDADQSAIAAYLLALPAIQNGPFHCGP